MSDISMSNINALFGMKTGTVIFIGIIIVLIIIWLLSRKEKFVPASPPNDSAIGELEQIYNDLGAINRAIISLDKPVENIIHEIRGIYDKIRPHEKTLLSSTIKNVNDKLRKLEAMLGTVMY